MNTNDPVAGEWSQRGSLVVWVVFLALALWFLHVAGTGTLAAPPLGRPGDLGAWISRVGAGAGVVSVLRLLALFAAWYLVVVTIVGAIARQARSLHVVDAANALTPAFLRRILASATGLTFTAAGLAIAVSPLLSPDLANSLRSGTASAQSLDNAPRGPGVLGGTAGDALLEQVPDPTAESESATMAEYDFELAPLGSERIDGVWMVEQGDHLWSIATETLAEAWGRTPTDHQVVPYWMDLIDINRENLTDPNNPDLLYPGQIMTLPVLPAMPAAPHHARGDVSS